MTENNNSFSMPVRVYFEDTDSGGIVYYANYLKFMERARTEFLRTLGFEQNELSQHNHRLFVVKHVSINYVRPARFNALLDVSARVEAVKNASLSFFQAVTESGSTICSASVLLACLNTNTMLPARIPREILEAIARER